MQPQQPKGARDYFIATSGNNAPATKNGMSMGTAPQKADAR